MNQTNVQLDEFESQLLTRASNTDVTRRRIWYSVLVPLALIVLLIVYFGRDAQPRLLLWLFVGYVAINMIEKVSYGFAVLATRASCKNCLLVWRSWNAIQAGTDKNG